MADKPEKHPVDVKSPQDTRRHADLGEGAWFAPAVDIYETESEVVILADVPGARDDGVEVFLDEDELVLTALIEPVPDDLKAVAEEFEVGHYHRHFAVMGIEPEGVKATMDNGVLRIALPKKSRFRARKINVE